MNNFEKWKFSLSIKITIGLAFIAFLLDFLNDLITSGWNFSKISPNWYTILFALLVLGISLVGQFFTNKLIIFINEILEVLSILPIKIKNNTNEIVGNIKKDINDFKRKLSSGIVEHGNFTYRALIYHEDRGKILNSFSGGEQSSRNILFSNKTINLIFRGIKDIESEALKRIGRKSSERFAKELVEDIRTKIFESQKKKTGDTSDLYGWIQYWISFDSDAGFGKFFIEKNKEIWKNQKTIILKYSFLAQDYEMGKSPICDFMTGYIEGILNYFPHNVLAPYGLEPKKIVVSHNTSDPKQCICAGREPSEGCIFFINKLK